MCCWIQIANILVRICFFFWGGWGFFYLCSLVILACSFLLVCVIFLSVSGIRVLGALQNELRSVLVSAIFWKHKRPGIVKATLQNKNRVSRISLPDFILHNYRNQNGMIVAEKQKYRSTKYDRKFRGKPTYLWSPNLWKRRQEYTM